MADEQASGKRVALIGRFGGMNQREAAQVLRSFDAIVVEPDAAKLDWLVVGANEPPVAEAELVGHSHRQASARGELEILHETELWQRLGLVEVEQSVRRYYTPVMLAHLLGVSIRVIRRWHRRGLIRPIRTLHRLPYFDFQEVTTAKRLAGWIAAGASAKAIEQRLVQWTEVLPEMQRPLDQLSVLIEGKHVLLRSGEGLIEPGGQLRFDFEAIDNDDSQACDSTEADPSFPNKPELLDSDDEPPMVLSLQSSAQDTEHDENLQAMLDAVFAAEDRGDIGLAIDNLRVLLAHSDHSTAQRADLNFQLAELLYRNQQVAAAEERYYVAIECDPNFVEARSGLGHVLAETGRKDLALSAFQGVLSLHEDYADVHYQMARVLDELGRESESKVYWQRFIDLVPDSPWAGEAQERVQQIQENESQQLIITPLPENAP